MLMQDDVAPTAGATSVLDPFNVGASQNLTARTGIGWSSGGKWNSGDGTWVTDSAPTYATNNNLLASNIWNTLFGPDMEVGIVEGSVIDTVILLLRGNSNTGAQTGGYICRVGWNGICSIETVGTTVLSSITIAAPAAGDQFVFQARGPNLALWRKRANDNYWVIVCSAYSTTYSGTGYIGIAGAAGNNARIDSFTGGTVPIAAGGLTQLTFTSAGTGTSSFAMRATVPYGLAWNADALNNVTIGEQAVGRRVGILFTAPVTANLNSFTCALAYGPGYSLGTGGSVKCALVADDGTTDHFPTGSDIASVTVSTPVGSPGSEAMQTFTFGSPPSVTKGTRYHIVLESADASPASNFVSIDETYNTTPTTPVQPTIPDDQFYCNFKYNSGNPWEHLPHNSPSPVNWHYSDGTDDGFSVDYTPVVAAIRNVGGANRVRETFIAAASGLYTGLRVRLYRQSGTTVALTVDLKESGTVIATTTIPATGIVAAAAAANPAAGTWVGIDATIILVAGRTYTIELSAVGETTFYQAYPLRTAIDANWSGAAKDNRFTEGVWEYSTNSGGSWTKELGEDDYKMQAYFSVTGLRALTFTSTGTGTSVFTLSRREALTFTSTGTSASTFTLTRRRPLTFTSAGTGTSTFTLNRAKPMTFTSAGTSTSVFSLTRRNALTFTSTGTGTSVFTLNRRRPLTFTSTGTSTSVFTLSQRRALTFTSTGTSTSVFTLNRARPLTFTSAGTSTSTFSLNRRRPLTFTSAGTSTSTWLLNQRRALAFTSTGTSTSTFTLNQRRALTFTSAGTGTSTFTLNRARPLSFTSAGTSTSTFTLTTLTPGGGLTQLTFTSAGTSTSTFALTRFRNLRFVSLGVGTSAFGVQLTSYSTEVLADTPAAYWRMNESGATNFVDSSGNARTLTKVAGGWPAIGGLLDGDANGAAQLPAAGGNSDASRANTGLVGNPLTVEFWIEFAMPPQGGILLSVSNGSNGYWAGADMTSGGRWLWQLPGVGGAGLFVSPIEVAKRYHVVFVQPAAGGLVSLYLNGQFVQTINCGSMLGSAALFKINGWDFASGAGMVATKGTVLDEVAVYGSALSAGRILVHYNAGATGDINLLRGLAFTSAGTGTSTFTLNRERPLTFTSTGTSTSVFALNRLRPLAFTSAGTSASTFVLNRAEVLTFTSAGTSTSVFNLTRRRALTFTSAGTSTSVFTLNRREGLTFTSTGTSTSTFALTQRRALAFTSTGTGASTFLLTVPGSHLRNMAFTSAGVGTSTFTLAVKHALAFTSAGTSTSTFTLTRLRALAFTSAGTSTSTWLLNRRRALAFTSSGTSTSVFSLAVKRALVFTSAGVGTSTFTLAAKRALAFTSSGVGTSVFVLSRRRALSFVSSGIGTSSFLLNRRRGMTFVSAGLSASSFALTVRRGLIFASVGTSTSVFAITVLRIGGIIITTINACSDPRAGVVDCPAPVPSLVLVNDPTGGVVSCPTPGKVG
jgi:hypothetical protein